MPVNASPDFVKAEKEYIEAKTLEEKIEKIKKMISLAPSHKGAENFRAELKSRLKKLTEKLEKQKTTGKTTKKGIKKGKVQSILVGFSNVGKTTLFKNLTQKEITISHYPFSTREPELGTLNFEDIKIQIIDLPSFPYGDLGLINNTDTIILVVDSLEQIEESKKYLEKSKAKKILIFNKKDLLKEEEKRKISEKIKSEYKEFFCFFLLDQNENLEELKKKIFESFGVIRVYTKEPKKEVSKEPLILKENSKVFDAIEKISKSLLGKVKFAKIWGQSSKFQGQFVGLDHILKDKDIIELKIE